MIAPKFNALFTPLLAAAACGIALCAGGCAIYEPADPLRLAASNIDVPEQPLWPARDLEKADRAIDMSPGFRRVYVAGMEEVAGRVQPYVWSVPVQVFSRQRAGQGIVCEVQRTDRESEPTDPRVFMFYSSATPVASATLAYGPPPREGSEVDRTPLDSVVIRLHPHIEGAHRGIVIALRPISGSAYTKSTINEFRSRGWTVIETGLSFGSDGIGVVRESPDDCALDAAGKTLAGLIDARLAETAYGVEAVLSVVRKERPDLADAPVVMVGFSAGAIGAPTVAARLGPQVRAAALIGGGTDILRISQTSSLSDFGLTLRCHGAKLTPEQIDRASASYLANSRLDPYHTAPLLSRTPVLMLHGSLDTIVPAKTGEMLYERLGRPERWVFDLGHELLIWRLDAYASDIANWVENAAFSTSIGRVN